LRRSLFGPSIVAMDRPEYEAFWKHHRRVGRVVWSALACGAVLCGFAVGVLWSFAVGFLVAALLALAAHGVFRRWDKAHWIKRFPEAEFTGTWHREPL
jgi:hypothetical protein